MYTHSYVVAGQICNYQYKTINEYVVGKKNWEELKYPIDISDGEVMHELKEYNIDMSGKIYILYLYTPRERYKQ